MVVLLSHLLALSAFCHHRPFVSFVSTVDLLSVDLLSIDLSPVDLLPPHLLEHLAITGLLVCFVRILGSMNDMAWWIR
jgi:hypothetical protein